MSDPIELKSAAGNPKPLFERSSCDVFVHRAEWKYPCRAVRGQTDLERWELLFSVSFTSQNGFFKEKEILGFIKFG